MAATRTTMRKIKEVLRLRYDAGLSYRQIAASTKVSLGSIKRFLERAEQLEVTWPLPDNLSDAQLSRLFFPQADTSPRKGLVKPDWPSIHQELKRKGMTKQLLWEEYTQAYPNHCYSYSQFCDRYRHWCQQQKRSMRQTHKAGEKLFIDYCGPTVPVVDEQTGECRQAQVFVAVLGASNYTYCEATWSQSLPDWLRSHVRTFEFLGGVPSIVVPDNLKSGVHKACRYEPQLNPSYQQLAEHYQVAVIPARPYKPKDKAKAEVAVQIVERWILARLRHQQFFSLAELNQAIRQLLTELNQKPFKQLPGNRQEWFQRLDQPALKPLPRQAYRYTDIKTARVNIDYHIQYQQHCYSVPHHLVGEQVEVHADEYLLRFYFQGRCIAIHPRQRTPGMTTQPGHMPKRHHHHQRWTPGRLKNWAASIGPDVLNWVEQQLQRKAHPEQAYRVCLGLLNLSRDYPAQRLNRSCALAARHGLYRLKNIKAILKSGQDQLPAEEETMTTTLPQDHDNVRGPKSFH